MLRLFFFSALFWERVVCERASGILPKESKISAAVPAMQTLDFQTPRMVLLFSLTLTKCNV